MEHFTTQENMDMLFGILTSSNPNINPQNSDILQIFNNTLNSVIKVHGNSSLIEMNKIFLKTIMDTLELYFSNKNSKKVVYRNKEEEQKARQDEFNRKFEQQQRNFGSFNKKKPDEIDFSDSGGNFGPIMGLDQTLEQRANELKKITQNYKKNNINDGPWLNSNGVVNLKISDTNVDIEPIILDEKNKKIDKRVRFKSDNEEKIKLTNFLSKIKKDRITKEMTKDVIITEERIKKIEKEVSEIRRLIKEVIEQSKNNKETKKSDNVNEKV